MKIKRILAASLSTAILISSFAAFAAERPVTGDNLTIGVYEESAAKTQNLIDARPETLRPMEKLGRGGVAVRMDGYTYLSWRWLGTESVGTKFNVYKTLGSEWALCNSEPLNVTNFSDLSDKYDLYKIVPVRDGKEIEDEAEEVTVWDKNYMDIPIQTPPDKEVNGEIGRRP